MDPYSYLGTGAVFVGLNAALLAIKYHVIANGMRLQYIFLAYFVHC
jgi:hypothetical protein